MDELKKCKDQLDQKTMAEDRQQHELIFMPSKCKTHEMKAFGEEAYSDDSNFVYVVSS